MSQPASRTFPSLTQLSTPSSSHSVPPQPVGLADLSRQYSQQYNSMFPPSLSTADVQTHPNYAHAFPSAASVPSTPALDVQASEMYHNGFMTYPYMQSQQSMHVAPSELSLTEASDRSGSSRSTFVDPSLLLSAGGTGQSAFLPEDLSWAQSPDVTDNSAPASPGTYTPNVVVADYPGLSSLDELSTEVDFSGGPTRSIPAKASKKVGPVAHSRSASFQGPSSVEASSSASTSTNIAPATAADGSALICSNCRTSVRRCIPYLACMLTVCC